MKGLFGDTRGRGLRGRPRRRQQRAVGNRVLILTFLLFLLLSTTVPSLQDILVPETLLKVRFSRGSV